MWLAMVAFRWLSQILRVVGISCSKTCIVVHMLGIWVSGKQSRPCSNGFGGLDCIWMWKSLWLVALFVNVLRTLTRLPLVCWSRCLYHITSLSTGPWTLSLGYLTLMGTMHFWFAWISSVNCVKLFRAGQGRMSWVLLSLPNCSLSILYVCMVYRVSCYMTETQGLPQLSGKNCEKS